MFMMPPRLKRLDTGRQHFHKMTLGQERDGIPSGNHDQPPTISIQSFLSVKELHQNSVYLLEIMVSSKKDRASATREARALEGIRDSSMEMSSANVGQLDFFVSLHC